MSSTTQRAEEAAVAFTEHVIQADGVRIRYLEAGQGNPVVVLQSAEGSTPSPFHTLLAQQFRVIVLEISGFGPPPLAERPGVLRDVAQMLAQAADALGLERYVLVSSSTGTPQALWLALHASERIEALVLISPPALLPEGRIAANGSIHDAELERRLADVRVATLVLLGTNDKSIPLDTGRTYVERLPDCYYLLVYDAGHAMETERPEALCEAVCDFIERRGTFIVERKNTAINP
jgi:pimeloyl-ACP methyl ester carboxylesterase